MTSPIRLSLFFAAPPGLEGELLDEAKALGFSEATAVAGGVETPGSWEDVWRANLWLRGASRVLVRIADARIGHLSQLDKWARKLSWSQFLRPDIAVRVEATSKRSRLYHSGAIAQRVETAITASAGARADANAMVRVFVRIEKDLCQISLDTSGELLHKRGFKQAVAKAPMRETMAALLLRACGYRGEEPVFDPMCGSGTIAIEAAEIACGLAPGRARTFAFESLASFDAARWRELRPNGQTCQTTQRFFASDRDAGAVAATRDNAERAGVASYIAIQQQSIGDLQRPDGPPGLVFINPPYGERIGDSGALRAVHASFGAVMRERFSGWRVGLVTSDPALARATGLPFAPPSAPIPHGPLKVRLFQTSPLK